MADNYQIKTDFSARDRVSPVMGRIGTNAGRMSAKMAAGLKATNKALASLDRGMRRVDSGFRSIATTAGVAGLAVAGIGKYILQTGADFEEAITAVGAVSLLTRDEIQDLEKEAIRLGSTTKFTATQAANAMELMGKAGFTNGEILQGVGGILNAAAAEGMDLAETAGHVSNVLKGMGLQTTEATRVADVLTLASARTNSSISSLGESMSNVASTARTFRIPLEDAVASVALLQDVGLDASVAGSAVNTMLTKMAAPTKEMRAQMKALGVSFEDAEGNMLPIRDVFAQLQKGADGVGGNMKQVAFFADLVGLRGQKAAQNLADLFTSGKFATLSDELKGAAGSAEKMSKLRMQNLKGDITLLSSAVDGVKVSIFALNGGPLRSLVQATTQWVTANQALIRSRVQEYIVAIATNLPKVVTWTQRAIKAFVAFKIAHLAIKATQIGFLGITAAMTLYTQSITEGTTAFKLFNLVASANPLVWVVGAVVAVALLAYNWREATNAIEAFTEASGLGEAAESLVFSDASKKMRDQLKKDGLDRHGMGVGDPLAMDRITSDIQNRMKAIDEGNAETAADAGDDSLLTDQQKAEREAVEIARMIRKGKELKDNKWDAMTDPEAVAARKAYEESQANQADLEARKSPLYWQKKADAQLVGTNGSTGAAAAAQGEQPVSKAEIVIKDQTGTAEVSKPLDPKFGTIKLKKSGTP